MFKQLSEKYEILELIGKGGMGEVYKAIHKGLNRTVAIKMLSSDLTDNEEFRRRFQQEAQIIARLDHHNIIKVYDIDTYNNKLCIIMEYIDGESLESQLMKCNKFNIIQAIELIIKIAQALEYAHNQGIIHRDIKPDNIMIDKHNNVKLMDFGIARMIDATLKTQTGQSMGTPKYMSPEQVQGKKVTKTADIYSLGIILYRLVTGGVPFEADNFVAIAMKHINEQPTPPNEINPQIDKKLSKIILKCLEKDAKNRYQSCEELCDVIVDYRNAVLPYEATKTIKIGDDTRSTLSSDIEFEAIEKNQNTFVHKKLKLESIFYIFGTILLIVLIYIIVNPSPLKKYFGASSDKKVGNGFKPFPTKIHTPYPLSRGDLKESEAIKKSLNVLREEWDKVKWSENPDERIKVLEQLVEYYPLEEESKNWKYLYGESLYKIGIRDNDKIKLQEAKKHLEEVVNDFKDTPDYNTIRFMIDDTNERIKKIK